MKTHAALLEVSLLFATFSFKFSKSLAVKCNLTKLTTKSRWYSRSAVFVWYCRLSAIRHCTSVFQRVLVVALTSFCTSLVYSLPSFCPHPFPSPSPLLTQCDVCLEDCVGAHDWVAAIASHGSIILSRGRLVTVEVPAYPRHPYSVIQHEAVVNWSI